MRVEGRWWLEGLEGGRCWGFVDGICKSNEEGTANGKVMGQDIQQLFIITKAGCIAGINDEIICITSNIH